MPHHDIGVEEFLLALGRATPLQSEANEGADDPDRAADETSPRHGMAMFGAI